MQAWFGEGLRAIGVVAAACVAARVRDDARRARRAPRVGRRELRRRARRIAPHRGAAVRAAVPQRRRPKGPVALVAGVLPAVDVESADSHASEVPELVLVAGKVYRSIC